MDLGNRWKPRDMENHDQKGHPSGVVCQHCQGPISGPALCDAIASKEHILNCPFVSGSQELSPPGAHPRLAVLFQETETNLISLHRLLCGE